MTASQQPTGHDKAASLVAQKINDALIEATAEHLAGQGPPDTAWFIHEAQASATAALAALRAALAAGDADVAEALDVPTLLAAAKAEALRGAADRWQQGDWIMVLPTSLGPKAIGLGQRVTDWLRARADRTEA